MYSDAENRSEIMMDIDEWDYICLADVIYEDGFIRPIVGAIATLLRQNRNAKASLFPIPWHSAPPSFSKDALIVLVPLQLNPFADLKTWNACVSLKAECIVKATAYNMPDAVLLRF